MHFARSNIPAALAVGVALLGGTQGAQAQNNNVLDRFSISIGAYHADPKARAVIGDQESTLSSGYVRFDEKTLPRVAVEALIGDSHSISFEAYRYRNNYSRQFVGDYSGDGGSASANVALGMKMTLDVARLGYRYWFGSDNTKIGVGAGVAYYRIETELAASGGGAANLTGLGFVSGSGSYRRSDSAEALAPMAEIGVRHAFSPDFRVFVNASGIGRESTSGIRGVIYNTSAGIEIFPTRNLGLTVGYAISDVDLKRDRDGLQRVRVKFQGPTAALRMRF